jgi:hypothetical protein
MPEIVTQPVGAGITPTMPTEPPAEVKAMTFSMEPELIGKDTSNTVITNDKGATLTEVKPAALTTEEVTTTDKTVEAVKEEVKLKQEEKKSVLTPPKDEGKSAEKKVEATKTGEKVLPKPITPVREKKEDADTFDYAKYTPEQQQVLKQMSNTAKKEYARVVDENKQLASLKDSTYLQHDDGYTLAPEYRSLQEKDHFARTEGQCWEQALLNIKAGKTFRDITGFDPKTGRPIMSEERQPTDRDEIRINNNLAACINAVNNNQQQLATYPQQFKQRVTQDLSAINQEQANRFAWVQDPKLLDYTVPVEGQGEKKLRDIKSDFKSMFPSYLSSSPGVDVASNLMVALIIQSAELREAKNGQQVAQIKQSEIQRGEPTSDASPREVSKLSAKGVPSTFSLEGLPSR